MRFLKCNLWNPRACVKHRHTIGKEKELGKLLYSKSDSTGNKF